ncbi:4Fe-4S ferredoxin iron-sulfur binding domain-containing protein [Desulfosarcina cetonica]|uniref:4Fe-4S dicluster domain-containing protein n=1 Tax=Desulfosarcina cetonica TaxID=90730 RepID=UPI0006D16D9F|nr:4Fe-4S dicluster domain-containing protein [Desulfosarcina cetonica]VTR69256.1 4Fe-4S ferredoxin iron-sulfur binding domain-containing protein [Desulfosarcina cetonica]
MTDIYKQLATFLDNLPAGYPSTDSGLELRILKRLFTPEEAAAAMTLTMIPETVAAVAARTGRDAAQLETLFAEMAAKGLIFRISKRDQTLFSAAQFVVGIWEYHLNSLDEGLVQDVNAYMPTLLKKGWLENETKQLRVVPVSKSLSADMAVMPYEAAEAILKGQSKIVVSPCICRKEQKLIGKGCDKPMETCFSFGAAAFYYEKNGLGRSIDKAEALEILKAGVDAGLVLQPGNQQKTSNICMCCGCCCGILKNLKTLDKPALAVHTNYFAKVVEADCIGCGDCVARCQMDAIVLDDVARVDAARCIGCGLCVTGCPTEAMRLSEKNADARYVPPRSVLETYMNIAKERGLI